MTVETVSTSFASGHEYLDLRGSAPSFRMALGERTIGGRTNSLFGGAGLAAAVAALQAATERPAIWVTAQFISPSAKGRELSVDVDVSKRGRSVTQAEVTIADEKGLVVRALGACGQRDDDLVADPPTMPEVVPPEQSEPLTRHRQDPSLHDYSEVRMATGMFGFSGTGTPTGTGSTLQWARMPGVPHDAVALAIMADFMPSATGDAVSQVTSVTSLDNTIRFVRPIEPTNSAADEWILIESSIQRVADGFGTGSALLWRSDGVLLATASQSFSVMAMPDAPPAAPAG